MQYRASKKRVAKPRGGCYLVAATLSRNALAGETQRESINAQIRARSENDRGKCAFPCRRRRRGRVAHPDDESVIDRPNCDCLSHEADVAWSEERRRRRRRRRRIRYTDDVSRSERNARNKKKREIQARRDNDTVLLSNCRRWLGKRLKSVVVTRWQSSRRRSISSWIEIIVSSSSSLATRNKIKRRVTDIRTKDISPRFRHFWRLIVDSEWRGVSIRKESCKRLMETLSKVDWLRWQRSANLSIVGEIDEILIKDFEKLDIVKVSRSSMILLSDSW